MVMAYRSMGAGGPGGALGAARGAIGGGMGGMPSMGGLPVVAAYRACPRSRGLPASLAGLRGTNGSRRGLATWLRPGRAALLPSRWWPSPS